MQNTFRMPTVNEMPLRGFTGTNSNISLLEESKNLIEILLCNATLSPDIREMAKETLAELKNKIGK